MLLDSVPAVVEDPYRDERELLAAGEPVMSETCYDLRPGDTDQPRFPRPLSADNSFGSWFNSGFPTGSTRNSAPAPSPAPSRPATAIPPR